MRQWRSIWTVVALAAFSAVITSQTPSGHAVFEQALAKERVDGNLPEAIRLYERVVTEFASDRALAARALVQVGLCYEKLGREEAIPAYERLVRDFGDQEAAAKQARARLTALTKVAAPVASPARRLVVDWGKTSVPATKPTSDGRHLLRYNENQRAFELVEIGTNNVRQLTTEGPTDAWVSPVSDISTDGRRVASVVAGRKISPADGRREVAQVELRVFDIGGQGPGRVLAEWDAQTLSPSPVAVQAFAWAPRGDRVWLFILRRDFSAQIAAVDMSGKLEVLKTLAWRNHTQAPSLSPDGRFLAYHDAPDRQHPPDLYILAADGSREHRVEHPADDNKPAFLPDGSGVVFESNRRGVRDLWFQAVTDGRPAGPSYLVWRSVGAFGTVHGFTNTGSLLFYFATNDWGTYTVPLDLNAATGSIGAPTRLAPVANESTGGGAFSPDGRYLAHFRANAARLVIRELTTGLEREIPFGANLGDVASADWCSNGDIIIATGYVGAIGPVAYRINVKDASAQRFPIAPFLSALCVGDEEIVYVQATAGTARDAIVRRSLASGRETTLFEGEVVALARSMDGKRLALVTIDPNGTVARLVTMSAAGGDVSADLMTSSSFRSAGRPRSYSLLRDVAWMPNGDQLLVVRGDEGESFTRLTQPTQGPRLPPPWFWEVPLTGSAPRKLGLLPLPKVEGMALGARNFTVHPDGKQLAFQSHEGFVQQTWAIDNLFQFIKAGGGQ